MVFYIVALLVAVGGMCVAAEVAYRWEMKQFRKELWEKGRGKEE